MNHTVFFRIKKMGFCCPFAFFSAHEESKEAYLASLLKVTPRTIRNWRRRIRDGQLDCEQSASCLFTRKGSDIPL